MPTCVSCNMEFTQNAARNKECGPCRDRRRRKKARDFIDECRSKFPCAVCGESDPYVIQFHHKDPDTKYVRQTKSHRITGLSGMANSNSSINSIMIELEKCISLCANCHLRVEKGKVNVDDIPTITFNGKTKKYLGIVRERQYIPILVTKTRH